MTAIQRESPNSLRRLQATARADRGARRLMFYVVGILIAAMFVFPLVWSALAALKPPAEALASPPTLLPSQISFDSFAKLGPYGAGIVRHLANSVAVSAICVVGTVVLGTLAGYGFSRFRFRGRSVLFVAILATLMIPFQSILIPLFLVLNAFKLTNSLFGLGIVYMTFQIPFAVYLMRNSFDNVPLELEDAARVDGASSVGVLVRVMLPIVRPGIVSVALFAFLAAWNEFLAAVIFLSSRDNQTLPIVLLNVQLGNFGTVDWGALQAGTTLAILPCVVLFLILQRYYVNGLIAGAVKA
jgi:multiple sugar transport system permease protein